MHSYTFKHNNLGHELIVQAESRSKAWDYIFTNLKDSLDWSAILK